MDHTQTKYRWFGQGLCALVVMMAAAGCSPLSLSMFKAAQPDHGYQTAAGYSIPTTSGQPLPQNAPIIAVAQRVLPVARQMCQDSRSGRNCDFILAVDDDPRSPANAFQTLDAEGRPVIVFTQDLLRMAKNGDELAFVLGHEAAHHIAGHLPQSSNPSRVGAILAGVWAQVPSFSRADSQRISEMGAQMSEPQYPKELELEADTLGARLAWAAQYDPLLGAQFFARLPDPGEYASTSHPANAQRQAAVANAVAGLQR